MGVRALEALAVEAAEADLAAARDELARVLGALDPDASVHTVNGLAAAQERYRRALARVALLRAEVRALHGPQAR